MILAVQSPMEQAKEPRRERETHPFTFLEIKSRGQVRGKADSESFGNIVHPKADYEADHEPFFLTLSAMNYLLRLFYLRSTKYHSKKVGRESVLMDRPCGNASFCINILLL